MNKKDKIASECSQWPWINENPVGAEHATIRDARGRRVAIVSTSWPVQTKQQKINTKIIKSAPELLNLVEQIIGIVGESPDTIYSNWANDAKKILDQIKDVK